MDTTTYHKAAMATSVEHATPEHRLVNAALGLAGEAGEVAVLVGDALSGDRVARHTLISVSELAMVAEHIKKARYHGRTMDAGALRIQLARVRRALARLEEAIEGEYLTGAPAADALHLDDLREPAVIDEGGDVLWYVTQLADGLGLTLTDLAERNVEKLRTRWFEGFSLEGRADA
jgi:NTP pyrophosphatase (non-canonical NTP hydrolase)